MNRRGFVAENKDKCMVEHQGGQRLIYFKILGDTHFTSGKLSILLRFVRGLDCHPAHQVGRAICILHGVR
jgi:serine acetyltransferase